MRRNNFAPNKIKNIVGAVALILKISDASAARSSPGVSANWNANRCEVVTAIQRLPMDFKLEVDFSRKEVLKAWPKRNSKTYVWGDSQAEIHFEKGGRTTYTFIVNEGPFSSKKDDLPRYESRKVQIVINGYDTIFHEKELKLYYFPDVKANVAWKTEYKSLEELLKASPIRLKNYVRSQDLQTLNAGRNFDGGLEVLVTSLYAHLPRKHSDPRDIRFANYSYLHQYILSQLYMYLLSSRHVDEISGGLLRSPAFPTVPFFHEFPNNTVLATADYRGVFNLSINPDSPLSVSEKIKIIKDFFLGGGGVEFREDRENHLTTAVSFGGFLENPSHQFKVLDVKRVKKLAQSDEIYYFGKAISEAVAKLPEESLSAVIDHYRRVMNIRRRRLKLEDLPDWVFQKAEQISKKASDRTKLFAITEGREPEFLKTEFGYVYLGPEKAHPFPKEGDSFRLLGAASVVESRSVEQKLPMEMLLDFELPRDPNVPLIIEGGRLAELDPIESSLKPGLNRSKSGLTAFMIDMALAYYRGYGERATMFLHVDDAVHRELVSEGLSQEYQLEFVRSVKTKSGSSTILKIEIYP